MMKCPACSSDLGQGFLYVRGIGAALYWSDKGDAGFLSRKDLEQIDLGKISKTAITSHNALPSDASKTSHNQHFS